MGNRRRRAPDPDGSLLGSYIQTVDERLLAMAAIEVARTTGAPHLVCLEAIRAAWSSDEWADQPVNAETWLQLIATTIAAVMEVQGPGAVMARAILGESGPWSGVHGARPT